MNVFSKIRNQIVKNEIYGNERIFKLSHPYPENVIVWLVRNKVFKLTSVKRNVTKDEINYEIKYESVNTGSDFLEKAYESMKYKLEQEEKRGYVKREIVTAVTEHDGKYKTTVFEKHYEPNEMVTTKFNNIADKYRMELECPNWNSEPDETGYMECPMNERGYEHLSLDDNCCMALVLQGMGYKNYDDFCEKHQELSITETNEELTNELKAFLENCVAEEWAIGEETEELI